MKFHLPIILQIIHDFAMRSYHERKRHNEVVMGLSFVSIALLVLGFMGMAHHLELVSYL